MPTLEERVVALEREVASLRDHVDASTPSPTPESGEAWVVDELERRHPHGAVVFGGNPRLGNTSLRWQWGRIADDLVHQDWAEAAPVVAALGHPVRLALLRLVLGGTATTAELAEAPDLGLGTTGQLHHHLRALVSAGWLTSAGRGRYQIPPGRVVPLLVIVSASLPA